MEGRYGAYVTDGETNATLPKTLKPEELTLEEAAQLIDARVEAAPARGKKKVTKKAAPKKAAVKPATRASTAKKPASKKPAAKKAS